MRVLFFGKMENTIVVSHLCGGMSLEWPSVPARDAAVV
eukprot:COSAG02_NODE_23564_length_715_cov_0.722403_1_plen_37_part_10